MGDHLYEISYYDGVGGHHQKTIEGDNIEDALESLRSQTEGIIAVQGYTREE